MLPFEPALPFTDKTLWRLIERRARPRPPTRRWSSTNAAIRSRSPSIATAAERAAAGLYARGVAHRHGRVVAAAHVDRVDGARRRAVPSGRDPESAGADLSGPRGSFHHAPDRLAVPHRAVGVARFRLRRRWRTRSRPKSGGLEVIVADRSLPARRSGDAAAASARAGRAATTPPVRWIYYTSGSTADPKGAQAHRPGPRGRGDGVRHAARARALPIASSLVFPFSHIGGSNFLFSGLMAGCTLRVHRSRSTPTPPASCCRASASPSPARARRSSSRSSRCSAAVPAIRCSRICGPATAAADPSPPACTTTSRTSSAASASSRATA